MPFASWRPLAAAAALALSLPAAHAGLFDDEEARKAILDLRARIQANDETASKAIADLAASNTQLVQQVATLQRSLLELNNQLEVLRGEVAKLRGDGEQLLRDVATLQQGQKDANQNFDDRLRKLEPQKVALDGREFVASPEERQLYDAAIAAIRNGDFDTAAKGLGDLLERWPTTGYGASARFWLGNAQYGKRDYKGAVATFRDLVKANPDHPKAPEALLALANSQAEMKDTRSARRTLDELLKSYPDSEAATAGKERLASLK
ncbi:MAG: tol-pal system protein YbgF [Burkholderiaceae bacterium]|nr:tol-pal system protein YbgF [Burkholderiaceae bacterium]